MAPVARLRAVPPGLRTRGPLGLSVRPGPRCQPGLCRRRQRLAARPLAELGRARVRGFLGPCRLSGLGLG
eukprot:6021404-Alexandrium_andersonii.AAC.1